jgi:selenocysteine lyase/cysteine desulfurase
MGLLPIDINRIKADYFVFAGHKTLYGPFGIAGFIDNSKIKLKEFIIGGTGSDSLNLHMPEQYPTKYEPASPNILAIAGLNASLDWIDEIGIENILNSEKILIRKLVNEMKDIYGIELYLPKDEEKYVGIISLNMQDYNPNELGQVLDEDFNIAVRTGFHCAPLIHNFINTENKGGTVRISLGYFNSENDIDNLIRSLREL